MILMTAHLITSSFLLFWTEGLSLDRILHITLVTAISSQLLTFEDKNFCCTWVFWHNKHLQCYYRHLCHLTNMSLHCRLNFSSRKLKPDCHCKGPVNPRVPRVKDIKLTFDELVCKANSSYWNLIYIASFRD